MYSVESPFNEEDLLNTSLETLRIQEGPSKQMMESFENAVFQEIEKEKQVTVGKVPANHVIFKIVLFKHANACRKFFYLDPFEPLCSKFE